jgi:hypothetical protein
MELYASELFFRGNNKVDKVHDCCAHGKVIFKIGNHFLSDETQWCVSASAFRFLQTLFENHFMGEEQFLIPCCGHTMVPSEDGKAVRIYGCSNGVDFDIIHEGETVTVVTADGVEYQVSYEDYKQAVLSFVRQVMDFYQENPPRKFEDDDDAEGFSAFVAHWYSLYDKAVAHEGYVSIPPNSFEDYDAFTDNEILNISETGISLKSFRFINFKECAYNFKITNGGSGQCIGEREIEDLSFTFYTSPKPVMIKFIPKNRLSEFLSKMNTVSRFHKLYKQLIKYGYSTRDLS